MLAWSMNGQDLPFLNGYPVKLVVPGYFGTYWVKHLSAIEVIDHTFDGGAGIKSVEPRGRVHQGRHRVMKTPLAWVLPFALAVLVAAHGAAAAPKEIKLPPETAKLRISALPGYALATQQCLVCHSADYVSFQPPGMNQAQWTAEVTKVQHAFGAPISDDEVKSIGACLAVAYGTAKATDESVMAASSLPKPSVPATAANTGATGATIDVEALLKANACLACHALDKKVVGPAYRDVAAKYKGDGQALAKVEASIRQGGAGKWGPVPMPPNAGLSGAQAKALAEFVLKQ